MVGFCLVWFSAVQLVCPRLPQSSRTHRQGIIMDKQTFGHKGTKEQEKRTNGINSFFPGQPNNFSFFLGCRTKNQPYLSRQLTEPNRIQPSWPNCLWSNSKMYFVIPRQKNNPLVSVIIMLMIVLTTIGFFSGHCQGPNTSIGSVGRMVGLKKKNHWKIATE